MLNETFSVIFKHHDAEYLDDRLESHFFWNMHVPWEDLPQALAPLQIRQE